MIHITYIQHIVIKWDLICGAQMMLSIFILIYFDHLLHRNLPH